MSDLPIEPLLPPLRDALRHNTAAVLHAPPGAGKTTRVPLALLDEPWLAGRRIVMLEPRRLATRAAARRMAEMVGESVGQTVGYRIHRDTRVGPQTRIEVVTEGILTRMLQSDPALEEAGLVIFDEFHERSIHADLGLALSLQSKSLVRPDLRILVMSATLEGEPIAALLGGVPIITSTGRSFPVETHYLARRAELRLEAAVAAAVQTAVADEEGDILVFLPGAGEIRRVQDLLEEVPPLPSGRGGQGVRSSGLLGFDLCPLHGNLSQGQQDLALRPSPRGRRKIVLATSIAETSLTIEGVRVVIDGGFSRVPRFSPRTGMTRLETVRVTRASADQRRGRAGRLGPGVCYRLWAALEDHHLLPRHTPEILEADLAPLALQLAAAGINDPKELAWLDPPPAAAYAEAVSLLTRLSALSTQHPAPSTQHPALGSGLTITPHGRRMAELSLHPRLAHMLIRSEALGLADLASEIAAILGERDLLRSEEGPPNPDLRLRLDVLKGNDTGLVDREALRRVREEARYWRMALHLTSPLPSERGGQGLLLALAFPDRIAQRRSGQAGRFLLRNGQGAMLDSPSLALADYLVAAELDGQKRESRVFLAAPITLEEIEEQFGDQIENETVVDWDETAASVIARRRVRLGAMVLREVPWREADPEWVRGVLLEGLARAGVAALGWSDEARGLQGRLRFLHRHDSAWPDLSDESLARTLAEWLGPHLTGLWKRDEVRRLDLAAALLARLTWRQRVALDELAPTHLTVPSGSRIAIDYGNPEAPVLAVRLQEMFGLSETPCVAGGRVPLTIHLLSPARRPVQVTRDLAGFWRTTYFEVKKDLKGRYPKHYWPDDPLQAVATRRVKPRKW